MWIVNEKCGHLVQDQLTWPERICVDHFYMKPWTAPLHIVLTLFSSSTHSIYLQSKNTPVIAICFVTLSNSCYHAFLLASFSFCLSFPASCPLFFLLSFFSSGFNPPPNSGIYFLSGTLCPNRIACSLHTRSDFQDVWEHFASYIETRSNPPWTIVTNELQLCTFLRLSCIFFILVE